ncbi:hypothetical protein BXZ70DRAFT_390982 [Cristinia sonorae]|uniref:Uncharacterized protein n=1 Tax=Cristinia sonorae TaxID=1940300 RepID=A0A8K0UKN7_9AGAR|nr:hypothetical protein BXZ70DRAFT_390982 [Cristinia sonorae]
MIAQVGKFSPLPGLFHPPTSEGQPILRKPRQLDCWHLMQLYAQKDTSHLTPAELDYINAYWTAHDERVTDLSLDEVIQMPEVVRADPRNLWERVCPPARKWEEVGKTFYHLKVVVGTHVGLGKYTGPLGGRDVVSLKEAQEMDEVRLRSVKHLEELPVLNPIENYRGPKLMDLSEAARSSSLKYGSA